MSLSTVEMRDETVYNPLVIRTLESRVQESVCYLTRGSHGSREHDGRLISPPPPHAECVIRDVSSYIGGWVVTKACVMSIAELQTYKSSRVFIKHRRYTRMSFFASHLQVYKCTVWSFLFQNASFLKKFFVLYKSHQWRWRTSFNLGIFGLYDHERIKNRFQWKCKLFNLP